MSRPSVGGRHELGQNFLTDRKVLARIAGLIPPGPVVELGAGDGALTTRLAARPEPVIAVELDPRRVDALHRRLGRKVRVVQCDMLRFRHDEPHHVVSNVPFGITTPVLRHLLGQRSWRTAVLLLQWEVARKRAAVGGTTLLTAMWWPWYEFSLAGRVPSAAFRPRPAVDGGLLVLHRRERELVPHAERAAYQRLVTTAFRGDRLLPALRGLPGVRRWATREGVDVDTRPGRLTPDQWASLHRAAS
ncbi:23S ribosomal RNA methyltransferase Erm [Pseudonocardia sp. TRM90224]|uniref:23S ribosomal RNA methyltransferase Erm n=1 Tax=Pseudonocardia sp. TRM90224 TaxID=2812678 RepID=UPI001E63850E|nr:23S ribosomal RNA methyltransferase Erm [Pseudonocardia sp. TRM90224]